MYTYENSTHDSCCCKKVALNEKLAAFQKNYTDLKMAHAITPMENPLQLRGLRRTVARIATELTKRELQ
ncbi:MAG: 50S ribosomal protein L29 [Polaribacter sp.]|nr:50S ribosomal protein L29 [Polaribacter sp.]